jgi:hypothetical protein
MCLNGNALAVLYIRSGPHQIHWHGEPYRASPVLNA